MAASKQNVTPSSYRETLDGADKVRYDEKLRLIGNEDPYTVDLSDLTDDVKLEVSNFCLRLRILI